MLVTRLTLAALLLASPALASAPQTAPEPLQSYGCAVVLPDPADRGGTAVSACNGDAPTSFGAGVGDGGIGRAR